MVYKYFTVTYLGVVQVVCKRSIIHLKIPTLDLVLPLPVFFIFILSYGTGHWFGTLGMVRVVAVVRVLHLSIALHTRRFMLACIRGNWYPVLRLCLGTDAFYGRLQIRCGQGPPRPPGVVGSGNRQFPGSPLLIIPLRCQLRSWIFQMAAHQVKVLLGDELLWID